MFSLRGGLIPGELLAYYALGGALGVLPFVTDTALRSRLPRWARTLVFPSTAVALDWAFGLSSLGTLGSVAYSQFGFGSLTQLASITGIWGINFLIMWLAPVANELWEHGFDWRTGTLTFTPFAAVLLLTLSLGELRLGFFEAEVSTVRVAALARIASSGMACGLPALPLWQEETSRCGPRRAHSTSRSSRTS